jgi:CheY-like chemotaxis protein
MKRKILVVEDNQDCRELMVIQLRRLGYSTVETESGAKAIQKALTENPDLILMDLGLPGLDGTEATFWLKGDPRTKHIPIVVHTAWQDDARRQKVLAAGAEKILTKPVPPKLFESVLKELVESATLEADIQR